MEEITHQSKRTCLHIFVCFFTLLTVLKTFEDNIDLEYTLSVIIHDFKHGIFDINQWLPLEFSRGENPASKYVSFFIGEIFVDYIIINLDRGPWDMASARAKTGEDYYSLIKFDISKNIHRTQAIFFIVRLLNKMVIAPLLSLWALCISIIIYENICVYTWEARGLKTLKTLPVNMIIGNTFPQEIESLALFVYITLCVISFRHVPSVNFFFLFIGICTYLTRRERCMALLIGILSVNIPLLVIAIMDPRPLSNFATKQNPNIIRHYQNGRDVNDDYFGINTLMLKYFGNVLITNESNEMEENPAMIRFKKNEKSVPFQSPTKATVINKNRKKKNRRSYRSNRDWYTSYEI